MRPITFFRLSNPLPGTISINNFLNVDQAMLDSLRGFNNPAFRPKTRDDLVTLATAVRALADDETPSNANKVAPVIVSADFPMVEFKEVMSAEHPIVLVKHVSAYDYDDLTFCLLYTSPSPRDLSTSRMPSSA